MVPEVLEPSLDHLRQEYVLVQAWKKTVAHLRNHNWYCDTIEVDWTTVNLREFIKNIQRDLEEPEAWTSEPLRVVWAPKSDKWRMLNHVWRPRRGMREDRLRPLAHASLRDQVVTTGLMLCLANRVETRQGDPLWRLGDLESRSDGVTSYGNRLFCDKVDSGLRHRWGSRRLYRSFFQDYRSFLRRPTSVAERWKRKGEDRVFVVESDLAQFYDRVRPEDLVRSLSSMRLPNDDDAFFQFAGRVLRWIWHDHDQKRIDAYARAAKLRLDEVALPQGLVASGFFANAVLIPVDERLRKDIGRDIGLGITIRDVVRYVDDIRVVVTAPTSPTPQEVEQQASRWITEILAAKRLRLEISPSKTRASEFEGPERPILMQSVKMDRIQRTFSGGFDVFAGEEILAEIRSLLRSQADLATGPGKEEWPLSPRSDVRDQTLARFAAGKYRRTYRSIRPLLEDGSNSDSASAAPVPGSASSVGPTRTQRELDNDARAFAFGLVRRWMNDPSNVRLLRIALDIWPEAALLREVLRCLRPYVSGSRARGVARQVGHYCLAELFRAGATETGIVDDEERLAADLDIAEYRRVLGDEAQRVVRLSGRSIPWYVRQQALLFLMTWDPMKAEPERLGTRDLRRYGKLIRFLRGERPKREFGTLAVLATRCFAHDARVAELRQNTLSQTERQSITVLDPALGMSLSDGDKSFFSGLSPGIAEDLCVDLPPVPDGYRTLAEIVLQGGPVNPLRNELSILRFVLKMLSTKNEWTGYAVITPSQVGLRLADEESVADVESIHLTPRRAMSDPSLYEPPSWCDDGQRWRFQLGFLLRFILVGQADFTGAVQRPARHMNAAKYHPARSSWYLRLYGLATSRQSFGDDWLPVSEWMESLLLGLLRWPGCYVRSDFVWVGSDLSRVQEKIQRRIEALQEKRGSATGALCLPAKSGWHREHRSFRVGVVQTVVPDEDDLQCVGHDPTLSAQWIRKKHRRHLSSALEAVKQSLHLRNTHLLDDGALDLLVLPELAVHPMDLGTHIIPFVRQYKTIVLAGLTYREVSFGSRINSAMWVIPRRTRTGLHIDMLAQGKQFPTPKEPVTGFRPCQWIVEHAWADDQEPLRLTASVCYDATDLGLASDLRNRSDVYLIPAYNRDVATFDQMSLALHYHMYQLVVVVNNGQYGGSNAYWPRHGVHEKQVFHLHGQPQASIAFLEIRNVADFLNRKTRGRRDGWKTAPAGM